MSLASLTEKLPVHVKTQATVDVSKFYEEKEGTSVLVIGEPDLSHVSIAEKGNKDLRKDYPDLQEDEAYHVLLMAMNHKSPEGSLKEATAFYAEAALKNAPMFSRLRVEFYWAFPWLADIMGAAAERKKD